MFIWIHSSNLHADHPLKYCFLTLTVMEVIQSGCSMKQIQKQSCCMNYLNSYKVICEIFWPFWVTNGKQQNVLGKAWHLLIENVGNEKKKMSYDTIMDFNPDISLRLIPCSLAIWLWIYYQPPRNQLIQCHSLL